MDKGKEIFESIKDIGKALTLDVKEMAQQIGATLHQKGVQGASELGHTLFSGSGYVPYGPGQHAPDTGRGGR